MRIFTLLGLALLPILAVVSIFTLDESSVTAMVTSVIPSTSPTPCASPRRVFSNKGDDCDPAPSVDPIQLAERREKWEVEKAKLVDAKYPLTNEAWIDVDGDGKKDHLYYRVQRWENDFEGQLKITSSEKKDLWDHEFYMGKNDLAKFLVEVLDYNNVSQWVQSVFNKKAPYSFQPEQSKIRPSEIDESQLEHAAEIHKTSSKMLRKEILSQRKNKVFSYRAEWREDLMLLVYVPSIKQFICYARGY